MMHALTHLFAQPFLRYAFIAGSASRRRPG